MSHHGRALPSFALALCLAGFPRPAAAQKPTVEGRYEVELLTVEPGDFIESMFGHSAIRVVDRLADTDLVYNWGTLDWSEDVPSRFVAGPIEFYLGVESLAATIEMYRFENRTIRGQGLDLAPEQAERLAVALERNALPENRGYLYYHFTDNCSTRVRDAVDEASGGALRRSAVGPSPRTKRQHGYEVGAPSAAVVLLFDLVSNATWEEVPSRWESCFMPGTLHEEAARALLHDGRPLVFAERVHLVREGPPRARVVVRPGWYVFGVPALLLFGALLLLALRPRAGRALARVALAAAGLALGLAGSLSLYAWAGTALPDFERNEVLLHIWPTDLLLVVLGPLALGPRPRLARGLLLYLAVHGVLSALALGLHAAGVLRQDVVAVAVPSLACLTAAVLVVHASAEAARAGASGRKGKPK